MLVKKPHRYHSSEKIKREQARQACAESEKYPAANQTLFFLRSFLQGLFSYFLKFLPGLQNTRAHKLAQTL